MKAKFLRIMSILSKDLVCEIRSREGLAVMLLPGMLIAGLFRISGVTANEPERLVSCVLLVNLLLAGILGGERTSSSENRNECIKGLLICPAGSGEIYFAKFGGNFLLLCFFSIIIVPVLIMLFPVREHIKFPELLFSIILVNIALGSMITLLGFLVCRNTADNSLLSVVFIPVMLPVFIPALNLITYCFADNDAVNLWGKAAKFLVCFDIIFLTLGWLLFDFVLGEN